MRGSMRVGGLFNTLTATLVLQLLSCSGNETVAPILLSRLTVTLSASGLDLADASMVSLDGAVPRRLFRNSTLSFESIPIGKHAVAISGFADNCTVDGPNPIVVDASESGMTTVEFRLICTATTGVIAVAVRSSGSWDPLSFSLQVDAGPVQQILPDQETPVGTFTAGTHVVKVLNLPPSCKVVGEASSSVSVSAGKLTQDTVLASFDVSCVLAPSGLDEGWEIAFQRGDSSIMLVRADGSGTRVLTAGLAPSWSPDGKFLVYQRQRCLPNWGCSDDVWMIHPDGSQAAPITSSDGFLDSDPAVSPDGRSITFVRFWLGPDQSYLMVSDLTGAQSRTLASWDPYSTPTWSPDGTQVAFTCQGPSPTWELDICLVKDSSGCTSYFVDECPVLPRLVHLTSSRFVESDPVWSPDGLRIAFTLACSGSICPPGVAGESYIAMLDPVTAAVTPLFPGHSPAWSPDGKRLVFAGNASSRGLKVISLDGTGLRSLTNDPSDTAPSWR